MAVEKFMIIASIEHVSIEIKYIFGGKKIFLGASTSDKPLQINAHKTTFFNFSVFRQIAQNIIFSHSDMNLPIGRKI